MKIRAIVLISRGMCHFLFKKLPYLSEIVMWLLDGKNANVFEMHADMFADEMLGSDIFLEIFNVGMCVMANETRHDNNMECYL